LLGRADVTCVTTTAVSRTCFLAHADGVVTWLVAYLEAASAEYRPGLPLSGQDVKNFPFS
jgi:hypothetical protein